MKDSFYSQFTPSTFKEKFTQWLKESQGLWRLVLALIFVTMLSLFLHFQEVRMPVLEVGSPAKEYIVAQVDFAFPDEDATWMLKQQAAKDIGKIYKIGEKQLFDVTTHFEDYLIHDLSWRERLEDATYETMYEGSESIEELLFEARFTDARTLQKMKESDLSVEGVYAVFRMKEKQSTVNLTSSFWEQIAEAALPEKSYKKDSIDFLIDFYERQKWDFEEDFGLEKRIEYLIQENIPLQYKNVKAGAHIIEQGEKVSPRHVVMLQAMHNTLASKQNSGHAESILGTIALSIFITILVQIYFQVYHKDLYRSVRKMCLLVTLVGISFALAKGAEYLLLYKAYYLIELVQYPLIVPFAALLVGILLGAGVALFVTIFLTLVIGISLAVDHEHFIVLNLLMALCSILFSRHLHKRKDILEVCGKVWLCSIPVLLTFQLIDGDVWDAHFFSDVMCSFVFMSATAILVVGLLPLLEALFNVMTDMTLMEYMDPNNELLRRLSLETPGTYQHCLVVGNLSEAAARAIGANDLFCRVATLYHDIGKLFNPHYFTENQLGGFNIHQLLTPLESAHVIIAHVSEGEALAKKYHLPQSFIDVIKEHHGTTLVYYFYCKQIEQMEGDASKVNEKLFRYGGPKPKTKESAIIMIADTVEAASRSLDLVTEDVLSDMVNKLVAEKAEDGQLDECQLTFEELGVAKKAIVRALLVTRHLRVKYPSKMSSGKALT